MNFPRAQFWLVGLAVLAGWTAPRLAAQTVDARVLPAIVPVNHSAQYVIAVRGLRGDLQVTPPEVPGLVFSASPSRNSRMTIVNGRMSSEVSLTWALLAQTEGTYTIPGQRITVDGQELTIPDATVRVTPPDETLARFFGLELRLPEAPLYLGQMFPVTVRFYLQQGVEVSNLRRTIPLEVDVEGLVTTPIPRNPTARTVQRAGVSVYEFDFNFYATAVRAGAAQIRSTLPLGYRDPLGRRSGWQNVRLTAEEAAVDIQPLPVEGRPASFSDAVGQFDATAALSTRELTAGEPLTVTLSVLGQGNFERISAPEIVEQPGWRIFPPKTQFTAADEVGFRGEKSFEYLLIPDDASVEAVPALAFSFFDPRDGVYEEVQFAEEAITVLAAASGPASVRDFAGSIANGMTAGPLLAPDDLRPLLPALGTVQPAPAPPFGRAGTWVPAASAFAGLVFVGLLLRWRGQANLADQQRQKHLRKAAREAMAQARQAAQTGDHAAFLTAGFVALREAVASYAPRDRAPATFTWAEMQSWTPPEAWDAPLQEQLEALAQRAEAAQFAPSLAENFDLAEAQQTLEAALNRLGRAWK